MKHNYHIKVDPPMPSEETIAKHKDFNHVLQEYQKFTQPIYRKPLYKNPKTFLGLFLVIVIGYLVFQAVEEEKQLQMPQDHEFLSQAEIPDAIVNAEANSFLKPASPTLAVPVQRFDLQPGKPTTLNLSDSTQLSIPANAFSTAEGKPANGPIELKVRILRDAVDYSLVGLPMTAADGEPLQPNVALEIQAFLNGKPLNLNTGSRIEVRMQVIAKPDVEGLSFLTMNHQSRRWEAAANKGGVTLIEQPMKGKKKKSDGFGVVEFDNQGKPIHHRVKDDVIVKTYLQKIDILSLGMHSIAAQGNRNFTNEAPVRLMANGEALNLYTVYGIGKGEAVPSFFWPVRADFTFMLRWNKAKETVFYGFLPDGRVAWFKSASLNDVKIENEAGAAITAQVSHAPVSSKTELMQLLGI